MFHETSFENLFFTEHWPASTRMIKGNFSKKMKSFTNLCSSTTSPSYSLSNSRSTSISNLYNSNSVLENLSKSDMFSSQGSMLDIIEEE